LSARGTVFGALCADGFFGFVETSGVLSASVSDFMVWDEDYHLVVYREVGSIPEELLPGWGRGFFFSFLVVWLHNLVFNKPFCSQRKLK
jgi:hypothetical protein